MRNILSLTALLLILLNASCGRSGLKKYYTRISPEEFASYDSTTILTTSRYGVVYRAFTHTEGKRFDGFKLEFLVFERYNGKKKDGLYKLDESTELKDDSTVTFYGTPLKISGDTSNWPTGLWFYQSKKGTETVYKVDSIPKISPTDAQKLSPGIYLYQKQGLVKMTSSQSEEAFNKLEGNGFYYLPPPGRFYITANLKEIK